MLSDQATTLHGLYHLQTETSIRYLVSVENNSVVNHGKIKTGGIPHVLLENYSLNLSLYLERSYAHVLQLSSNEITT